MRRVVHVLYSQLDVQYVVVPVRKPSKLVEQYRHRQNGKINYGHIHVHVHFSHFSYCVHNLIQVGYIVNM